MHLNRLSWGIVCYLKNETTHDNVIGVYVGIPL